MGILNVTPDSFSDGGRFLPVRRAVAHALRMQEDGADLIDVGGESTRPGARPVPAREEMRRILPVIERLAGRLWIPISVDSSKASVVKAAIAAGASLVNDVTALGGDPAMGKVVARSGLPVILMHMRGTPRTMKSKARYRRFLPEVLSELKRSVRKALAAGVCRKNILIDPGIGFAKTPKQSMELIRCFSELKKLGYPVVVGPSRKSFIGLAAASHQRRGTSGATTIGVVAECRTLERSASAARTVPPRLLAEDRLFGTAAAVALCAAGGADILRVHDVAAMRQAALVGRAIGHAGKGPFVPSASRPVILSLSKETGH